MRVLFLSFTMALWFLSAGLVHAQPCQRVCEPNGRCYTDCSITGPVVVVPDPGPYENPRRGRRDEPRRCTSDKDCQNSGNR
jgi:hypothetical protein